MAYTIITNNPLVQRKYTEHEVVFVTHYKEVLITARNAIHEGARLLSHPQAGSIKPYETPYRTIIINKATAALDLDSLHYIETALERFLSLSASMGLRTYDESCLMDFQVIDDGLLQSALISLTK